MFLSSGFPTTRIEIAFPLSFISDDYSENQKTGSMKTTLKQYKTDLMLLYKVNRFTRNLLNHG